MEMLLGLLWYGAVCVWAILISTWIEMRRERRTTGDDSPNDRRATMPLHSLCQSPGCRTLAAEGARYCKRHARGPRGSAHARGYGRAWNRIRALMLAREPHCRQCRRAGSLVRAVAVDHIVPRSAGGGDTPRNLQPLCQSCHSRKTARSDGGFGND
jgi:5-methylcytosine-specific restriction protein A